MRKTKPEASWNELSVEQRETLDGWLFEKNLSYAKAWPRAKEELGFRGSVASLKRYYQRRSQEREELEKLEELAKNAAAIGSAAGDAKELRLATMKMVAASAFRQVREAPDDADKWGPAVKLMVDNDRNETWREEHELRREFKAEDRKVRREAMALTREKFQ